jgi:quinol monooxygenase YgiN
MIRMFARHPVSNYAAWKQTYDAFDAERQKLGVRGDAVFQAAGNPNDVTVWHDFEDLAAAQAFASSERLKEVMTKAGVTGEPTVWFTRQA